MKVLSSDSDDIFEFGADISPEKKWTTPQFQGMMCTHKSSLNMMRVVQSRHNLSGLVRYEFVTV